MSPKMVKQFIGAGLGLLIGLMCLWVGFFKTLLLVGLAGLGWWLCGSREVPEWLQNACKAIAEFISSKIPKRW